MGLPRQLRLRRSPDFRTVQRNGSKSVSRHLVVYWVPNPAGCRFGLTVSRKVGKAVTRNRVKRLLREAIRLERAVAGPSHASSAVDAVFIARSGAASASHEEIRAQVSRALSRMES